MNKQGYVYIIANDRNTVLYTSVTSDIVKRIYQHKTNTVSGFAKKYNCRKLVYFEVFESITEAIIREKQIKAGSRIKKTILIESANPSWLDFYDELL